MDSSLSSAIKDELGDEDKVNLKIEKKKTRYFVPTVPEPFQMTVREEGKRRERQLAKQFLNQGKFSNSKSTYDVWAWDSFIVISDQKWIYIHPLHSSI